MLHNYFAQSTAQRRMPQPIKHNSSIRIAMIPLFTRLFTCVHRKFVCRCSIQSLDCLPTLPICNMHMQRSIFVTSQVYRIEIVPRKSLSAGPHVYSCTILLLGVFWHLQCHDRHSRTAKFFDEGACSESVVYSVL